MEDSGHAGQANFFERIVQSIAQDLPQDLPQGLVPCLARSLARPQRWPPGAVSVPRMQAHRGYWRGADEGVALENTLEAFRRARAQGAQMIEMDVRLTRDLVPVVFHDEDLKRIGGSSELVKDMDLVELQKRTPAPSLRQVLESSDIPQKLNIELKTDRMLDEPLERKVLAEIVRSEAWGRVLISSFNPFSLWRMSLLTDRLPLALLVAEDLEYKFLREMWLLPFLKFHLLHVSQAMATDSFLQYWQGKGVPVSVWTVNDPQQISALLEKGCLSVISDLVLPL